MGLPYRARVSERWFLNLPGFHGGAYVIVYVEDTRERGFSMRRLRGRGLPNLPVQLRAADDSRDRRLQRSDQSRVRRRLGGGPCQLAAQARHSARGPARLSRGRRGARCRGGELRAACDRRALESPPSSAVGRRNSRDLDGRLPIRSRAVAARIAHRAPRGVAQPGIDAPVSDTGLVRVRLPPPAPCLRSSAEEHRASTPGAEVRILSGALVHDTVAERRGARLQSAIRRFESARCLFATTMRKEDAMSTIKTFGAVDAAQPRAARALHGGGRRRVRRPLRRPPPGLQPADRRRHRLRGLRLAVGRRLRHRLRQQGRAARS